MVDHKKTQGHLLSDHNTKFGLHSMQNQTFFSPMHNLLSKNLQYIDAKQGLKFLGHFQLQNIFNDLL